MMRPFDMRRAHQDAAAHIGSDSRLTVGPRGVQCRGSQQAETAAACLSHAALLDHGSDVGFDAVHSSVKELCIDLFQEHLHSSQDAGGGNAGPHEAATQHRHTLERPLREALISDAAHLLCCRLHQSMEPQPLSLGLYQIFFCLCQVLIPGGKQAAPFYYST